MNAHKLMHRNVNVLHEADHEYAEMMRAAFNYKSQIESSMYGYIWMIDAICLHGAPNFPDETPGMWSANGKVRLLAFETSSETLNSFIFGTS